MCVSVCAKRVCVCLCVCLCARLTPTLVADSNYCRSAQTATLIKSACSYCVMVCVSDQAIDRANIAQPTRNTPGHCFSAFGQGKSTPCNPVNPQANSDSYKPPLILHTQRENLSGSLLSLPLCIEPSHHTVKIVHNTHISFHRAEG